MSSKRCAVERPRWNASSKSSSSLSVSADGSSFRIPVPGRPGAADPSLPDRMTMPHDTKGAGRRELPSAGAGDGLKQPLRDGLCHLRTLLSPPVPGEDFREGPSSSFSRRISSSLSSSSFTAETSPPDIGRCRPGPLRSDSVDGRRSQPGRLVMPLRARPGASFALPSRYRRSRIPREMSIRSWR